MPTKEELKELQSRTLDQKIMLTQTRIIEWYEHWKGQVYISFSGGKDSTVLLHIARQIYPDIEAVFVDTGLEYPEIRKFVKTFSNVTKLKPKMRFDEVIKVYGWNFPSKDIAQCVWYARKGSDWAIKKLKGLNTDGSISEFKERYKKWDYLLEAPFIISNQCCIVMKEEPLRTFEKQTKKQPIIAVMAEESQRREDSWKKHGCNAFDSKLKSSTPMAFWTEQDVLRYIKINNLDYCSVYGEITEKGEIEGQTSIENTMPGELTTTGESRTGCMFCPTGCHLDNPNKYQRMKITHPKQYDYCMREENGLGLAKVLDYIGVKY